VSAAVTLALLLVAAPPPAEEVRRAVARVYEDEDIQRELPAPSAPQADDAIGRGSRPLREPEPEPRRRFTDGRDGRGGGEASRPGDRLRTRSQPSEPSPDLTFAPGPLLQTLLWVGVGILGLLLLGALLRAIARRREQPAARTASAAGAGAAGLALPQLEDEADALAREGRHAEAAHLLLLRTLAALARSLPHGLDRALTSREVIGQVPMPEPARKALGELARVVEHTRFGSRPATRADYDRSAQAFRSFVAALGNA
jgi:hypothetical protein